MFQWKADRRRVSVSLILYRIIILLTLLLTAILNFKEDDIPHELEKARQTLGQGLTVPAAPISGSSQLIGKNTTADVFHSACSAYQSGENLFRFCSSLIDTLPPGGGKL